MRLASLAASTVLVAACGSKQPAPITSGTAEPSTTRTIPCPDAAQQSAMFARAFPEAPAKASTCTELYRGEPLWLVTGARSSTEGELAGEWPSVAVFAVDDQHVVARIRGEAWVGADTHAYTIADLDGDGADEILVETTQESRDGVDVSLTARIIAGTELAAAGTFHLGGRERYTSDVEPAMCTGTWVLAPSADAPGPKTIGVTRTGPGCGAGEAGTFTLAFERGTLVQK